MTTQISVRLPEELVAHVDAEVAAGRAHSRAAYLHRALTAAQRQDLYAREIEILIAAKDDPDDPDTKSVLDWLATRTHSELDD